MDFRQITQPSNNRPAGPTVSPDTPEIKTPKASHHKLGGRNLLQLFNGIMLIAIAILIALVAFAVARANDSGSNNTESTYVNTSKYQAVFLNNGQVYFGKINTMTDGYLRLTDVYYLTQGDTTDNNGNYTLVKLGCQQIHHPYDAMVVNRSQVTFWENLSEDGKVASTIKQFKEQNPNGPDCSQVSNQTQADSNATTQGSGDTEDDN